jgi:hypothetical protein
MRGWVIASIFLIMIFILFSTTVKASATTQDLLMLWNKTISMQGGGGFYANSNFVNTPDGGLAFITHETGFVVSYLNKLGPDYNLQWSQTYSYGEPYYTYDLEFLKQTSDGGYVMAGTVQHLQNVWTVVVKTDNQGVVQWSKMFNNSSGCGVVQTDDGGFLVSQDAYFYKNTIGLIKLDTSGSILWTRTFNETNDPFLSYDTIFPWSITKTSDGGCIVVAELSVSNNGPRDIGWVKFNSNGEVERSGSYGGRVSQYSVTGVYLSVDNGYVIALDDSQDFFNNTLVKIGPGKEQQWSHKYDFGISTNIISVSDGYFFVSSRDNGYVHEWVKIGLDGTVISEKNLDSRFMGLIKVENGTYLLSGPWNDLGLFRYANYGEVSFNRSSYNVSGGAGNVSVSVVRSEGYDGPISVNYSSIDGSAVAGINYMPVNGMLEFGDNETIKTFPVQILTTNISNTTLSFSLALDNVSGGASLGSLNNTTIAISYGITPTPAPAFSILGIGLPFTGGNNSGLVQYPSTEKTVSTILALVIGIFLALFWPWLAKLLQFLYDAVKSYLQKQFSTKEAKYRGVTAKPKKPLLFGVSLAELFVGFACILLIGITFAYAKDLLSADKLLVIIVAAGITIVVSEMVRRFAARHYKAETEYKFWDAGAIILIITSILHQPFSRPARTIINKPGELGARKQGIIAMAPCVASLLLSIVFLLLLAYGNNYEMLGREGFKMGMMLCVYSLMPFEPMDGKRVINWNKWAWGNVFLPALAFYLGMLLFVFP